MLIKKFNPINTSHALKDKDFTKCDDPTAAANLTAAATNFLLAYNEVFSTTECFY